MSGQTLDPVTLCTNLVDPHSSCGGVYPNKKEAGICARCDLLLRDPEAAKEKEVSFHLEGFEYVLIFISNGLSALAVVP